MRAWADGPFLISAAPGAGKTRPALELARELLRGGRVAPRRGRLPDDAADAPVGARPPRGSGVHLVPDARRAAPAARLPRRRRHLRAGRERRPSAGRASAAARRSSSPTRPTTSARSSPGARASRAPSAPTRALAAALGHAVSLRRSADPGRALRRRRRACPTSPTRYADAVRDGICRPVTFIPYDGDAAVAQRRRRHRGVVRRRAHRRARRAAATARRSRPSCADGLPRILARRARAPRARCAPAATATRAGSSSPPTASTRARSPRCCSEITGARADRRPAHRGARGREARRRSRARRERWIVAVNMVSEGVDIPRLRVGVYATAAKTPLDLPPDRRALRAHDPGPPARARAGSSCPPTRSCARTPPRSSASCATSCARRRRTTTARSTSSTERRETERGERRAFVPLAADVAPQLALFGGGPPRPAPSRPRASAAGGADEPDAATMPAFERRALLRDKRHRLVADLRRSEGRSPRRDQRAG